MNQQSRSILYLCPNGFIGGAEKFVLDAAEGHLNRKKFRVKILFFHGGPGVDYCHKKKIPCQVLPIKLRLSRINTILAGAKYIRKMIRDDNIKLLHMTMPYSHIVGFLSSVFLPVKRVWFQHGPVGGLLDKIAVWLPVDTVLFNSKYTEGEHQKLSGLRPRSGTAIINLGVHQSSVDREIVREKRNKFLSKGQGFIFGTIGRISPTKQQHLFVEAATLLQSKVEPDLFRQCRFVIVGQANSQEDRNYQEKLKRQVKECSFEDQVFFEGFQSKVNEYYAAFDVFVSTSLVETFGISIAEAMLQRTLVIGSCHGGVQDILYHEETGLTFDSRSEDAADHLSKEMSHILNHCMDQSIDVFYRQVIDQAYELISAKYQVPDMVRQLESLYQDILSIEIEGTASGLGL